jgi:hypothetical protein
MPPTQSGHASLVSFRSAVLQRAKAAENISAWPPRASPAAWVTPPIRPQPASNEAHPPSMPFWGVADGGDLIRWVSCCSRTGVRPLRPLSYSHFTASPELQAVRWISLRVMALETKTHPDSQPPHSVKPYMVRLQPYIAWRPGELYKVYMGSI